jgi:hypothetical protein
MKRSDLTQRREENPGKTQRGKPINQKNFGSLTQKMFNAKAQGRRERTLQILKDK